MTGFWPKRSEFCEWIADAKRIMGATNNGAVADAIGLSPNSLKKYMGRAGTHKPGPEALRKLGDILGRDYRVLMDDPGIAPIGVSQEAWHQADDDLRAFTSSIFHEARDLTPSQRKVILDTARAFNLRGKK